MHICQCTFCNRDAYPDEYWSDEATDPNHTGLLFFDWDRCKWHQGNVVIFFEGRIVTDRCCGAMAGDPGWVVAYSMEPGIHRCKSCKETADDIFVCTTVLRGDVYWAWQEDLDWMTWKAWTPDAMLKMSYRVSGSPDRAGRSPLPSGGIVSTT